MSDSRPLGEDEQLFHGLHKVGALVPLQVLHIRGEVPEAALRQALDDLQHRHPLLRAHIRYGRPVLRSVPPFFYRQPRFETEGTSPIPLRVVEGGWEDVLAAEARQPLPKDSSPRLRVTLVRDPVTAGVVHLILCADHATIDAPSIANASRHLMEQLAGLESGPAPAVQTLPPALEERFPAKSNSGRAYQSSIRLPNRPVRGPVATRVISRTIDAATTTRLKAAAKARGATLHGAVSAAFLLSIGASYGLDELTFLSTLDLRRLCQPPLSADTHGCYVDIIRTRHKLAGGLWGVARDVAFRLVSTVARDHKVASILKVPSWSRYRTEAWPTLTHRRRLDCLTVTTAGESGLGRTYGALVLEDVTMAVSLDFFGPSMMAIASERDGALDLCVNFSTRILTPEDVAAITDAAVARLVDGAEDATRSAA